MKRVAFASTALFALPLVASAQTLITVVETFSDIINALIPVVVALALLVFFWGLVMFIFNQSNEEKRGKGKDIMIWGIIALFVMVSVWGLVNLLAETFNVGQDRTIEPPRVESF